MLHLFQVGAGSGGMPLLDLLCRDDRIGRVTLVEPDIYKPHNVDRHLFSLSDVGQPKAQLARDWLQERRPDLDIQILSVDLTDPVHQGVLNEIIEDADLGVCAADNEEAKYHFDRLFRQHDKPWTLGEVLSGGGIGGFVHCFVPTGPCYGCVASYLQRSLRVEESPAPDYSAPTASVPATTIPACKASIAAIASLHALVTLEMLDNPAGYSPPFTTLLWALRRVPGIFEEAFHPYRFHIQRAADCLICRERPTPATIEELDVALDQALARLADA